MPIETKREQSEKKEWITQVHEGTFGGNRDACYSGCDDGFKYIHIVHG